MGGKPMILIIAVIGFSLSFVWAQDAIALEHVHSPKTMDSGQSVDHSKMHHAAIPGSDKERASGTAHKHPDNSSHDSMSLQRDSAPLEPRDPHAYSEGYDFGPFPRPQMGDEEYWGSLLVDRLESITTRDDTFMTYDWQAWFGQSDDRVVARAEGAIEEGAFKDARNELLWGHAATPYWDTHLGVRYDSGIGPDRGWFAFGIQGLAPYWIYTEATAYIGEQGRLAFRLESEYDLLLTQKLILQPRIEANFYSEADHGRSISSGLSDFEAGVRLRYEIQREFAPYLGIEWAGKFGSAADNLRAAGNDAEEVRLVAGVRFWF
jgi:copper resistance protein B